MLFNRQKHRLSSEHRILAIPDLQPLIWRRVSATPSVSKTEFAIRAPTRIDFGGGWTDVPPYDVEQGGFVCNVAISRYATVRVRAASSVNSAELSVVRPSDVALLKAAARRYSPVAAGLGGSSAAGVASIAASLRWKGETYTREAVAEASRELEVTEMGIAGGRQDHYAAAFGGALGIRFADTVTTQPIGLTATASAELPRRCIVIYTGESRISGNTITAVMDAYRSGARPVRTALKRMRELAEQMASALSRGNLDELGALVGEHWQHQRSLDPAIPTPLIDTIIDHADRAGAIGSKALGASGGGCVLIVAPTNRVQEVRRAVAPFGMFIDYAVDTRGVSECP
jgi:D-glycero-alpha-D-manno-heptose-7-phosphate kinase